jgi:hypothetical protein
MTDTCKTGTEIAHQDAFKKFQDNTNKELEEA